jgi:hypothetical protein
MEKLIEVFYLSEPEYDIFLVGNWLNPVTIELIKLYSLN